MSSFGGSGSGSGDGKVGGAAVVVKEEKNSEEILASREENRKKYESGIEAAKQSYLALWRDIASEQESEQDFIDQLNRAEEQGKAGDRDHAFVKTFIKKEFQLLHDNVAKEEKRLDGVQLDGRTYEKVLEILPRYERVLRDESESVNENLLRMNKLLENMFLLNQDLNKRMEQLESKLTSDLIQKLERIDDKVDFKTACNAAILVPVDVASAKASNYWSEGENADQAILYPSKDSQWHTTDTSGWLEARLSKSTAIDSIRLISQEKLDGYYNGRIPSSVTFEGYRGKETIFTTPAQKISWSASSEYPESMIALASITKSCVDKPVDRVRMMFANSYGPECNTPPGHVHAYNGNKLSLRGVVLFAAEIRL